MFVINPFFVVPSIPPAAGFGGAFLALDQAMNTTYTYANPPSADRVFVVGTYVRRDVNISFIDGASLGGAGLSYAGEITVSNTWRLIVWYASRPSNTSDNLIFTKNNPLGSIYAICWDMVGYSGTPNASSFAGGNSATVTVGGDSMMLVMAVGRDSDGSMLTAPTGPYQHTSAAFTVSGYSSDFRAQGHSYAVPAGTHTATMASSIGENTIVAITFPKL